VKTETAIDLDARLALASARLAKLKELAGIEAECERLEGHLLLRKVGPEWTRVRDIIDLVAQHYNLSIAQLRSATRCESVARPRQVACWLCRKLTRASLVKIGQALNREHGTVIYAVEVISDMMEATPSFRFEVEMLEREIAESFAGAEQEAA